MSRRRSVPDVHKPRYFTSTESIVEPTESVSLDGCSMYRAISSNIAGDPSKYKSMLEVVVHFATRVRANTGDSLHREYLSHERSHEAETEIPLLTSLHRPDIYSTRHVCWVIAHALKLKLRIFNPVGTDGARLCIDVGASDSFPSCALIRMTRQGCRPFWYASLLPDESGKALLELLQDVEKMTKSRHPAAKQWSRGLQIRQISWAFDPDKHGNEFNKDVKCFNDWRPDANKDILDGSSPLNRFDAYTMVINDPSQLRPAIELFKHALRVAPNQRRSVLVGTKSGLGIMLPHIAADAEFVKYPREKVIGSTKRRIDDLIASGEIEELCSVLTLAIDRTCFLAVNILHMLENATKDTVPALQKFFEEFLLNPKIGKFWWNLQSDMHVLDNTIAYMYQGTPREPYYHTPYGSAVSRLCERKFHIRSSFLNGERPSGMFFPTDDHDCDIHLAGKNELGMSCPCPLGNIDMAALLSHMCRHFGLHVAKMRWTEHRDNVNYGKLLDMILEQDRLHPILSYMKDCPNMDPERADFYQELGKPGMEQDNLAMAYNIGDVAGINLILQLFLANDDMRFKADRLERYSLKCTTGPRQVKQAMSPYGFAGDIPLVDDNPKLFKREAIWTEMPSENSSDVIEALTEDIWSTSASIEQNLSWVPSGLAPWEHDEYAQVGYQLDAKMTIGQGSWDASIMPGQYKQGVHPFLTDQQKQLAEIPCTGLVRSASPSRIWFPETCATIVQDNHPNPVVRASTTQAQAVIECLLGTSCSSRTATWIRAWS